MSKFTNELGQPVDREVTDWNPLPYPPHEPMDGQWCRLEPLDINNHAQQLYDSFALDSDGRNWTYMCLGPFNCREFSQHCTRNEY